MYENAHLFFENYTNSFPILKEEDLTNSYSHKYFHTYRVVKWITKIVTRQNKSDEDILLAKTIALFHDLGRFEQFQKYKVYNDQRTEFDHAKESINLLQKEEWFWQNGISKQTEEIICKAILNHNRLSIESGLTKDELYFAKLIRDADKLAILEEWPLQNVKRDENNLSPSKEVFQSFESCSLINVKEMKNNIDRVLRILAYVFDFNWIETIQLSQEYQLFAPYLETLQIIGNQKDVYKIKHIFYEYIESRDNHVRTKI